jgi:hypothetical protein
MNRRESIKFIGVGSITAGMILGSCKPQGTETTSAQPELLEAGRETFEIERDKKLMGETFFDEHEMATITLLADLIIPADEKSGSATEAGVPQFIAKDMPRHQLPMRGGLRWLDMECLGRFEKSFVDCSETQRMALLEEIAYPYKYKPGMEQGVAFFNLMRDLTATGFYTSEMGFQDLEYAGNRPQGKWEGTPRDLVEKFGLQDFE